MCVCVSGGVVDGLTDGVTSCMRHGDVCVRVCQNEIHFGFVCLWCQNEIKFGLV